LADASTCKEGERWDGGLGRCVMNRSTSELQGDVTVCGSFSNPEDRRQCYVDNARIEPVMQNLEMIEHSMIIQFLEPLGKMVKMIITINHDGNNFSCGYSYVNRHGSYSKLYV
jgi:hypothetical protein